MTVLPDTPDVETKLLRYLASIVEPRSATESYNALGSQFGLSWSTRTKQMPNQPEPHWPNRVRSAMRNLVKNGYAESPVRNEWRATKKGREWINLLDSLDFEI